MAINEFGGAATLGNPAGIVTGPDGNLWFTELSPTVNAIGRITPSGAIQQFSTGLSSFAVATGIAAGPDNALWFTEYGDPSSLQLGITSGDKIGRIGVDGTITEYPLPVDPLTSQPRVGRPDFIALGTDGALWFTEHDGNRIGRIDPASKAITEFPIPTANSEPAGITSGPDGALWFTETNTDKIGRIDPATGQITEFGLPGGDNNRSPLGITSGPDNNLWFTESGSANNPLGGIGKITTDGVVTEFIAGQTPGLTPGAAPAGIVTGPDLNLYFTEANTGRLGRITTAGAVTELPLPGSQAQPTASPIPLLAGITVGPDGNLWAAATLSSRIIRSSTEGVAVPFPAATSIDPGNAVIGIASGSDGALWFTETVVTGTTPKIGRIDLAGTITEFSTNLPSNADPRSIAAGSDGALWFTDRGTNSIGRITTTGQITEFPIPAAGGSASTPESITPGPDGALWFTNAAITDFGSSPVGTGFIGRITTDGVISTFASKLPVGGFQGRHTQGITAGPDGNLWFTDSTGGASFIGVITLAGAITTFPVSNSEESAGDITAGPDGALYFTEDDGLHGNIGRITTAGVITQIPVDQPGPFAVPTGIVLGPDRLLYFLNRNTDPNSPYSNSVVRINADGSFTTLPIPTAEAAPLGMAVGPEGNLYFTEGAVFFQDSVQPPVSQIGQVVLPQASVTERPVGDLLLGGAGETYSGIFASFTEDSGAATPANFAATIDYGDGQGGPGVVTRAPGQPTDVGPITYFVSGSHTFATAGTFRVTTTVFNQAGISTSTFITVVVPGAVTGSPIVTNLNDAGPGSLRQAILIANQAPGQTIVFNIPAALADPTTGLFSIRPTSPLPGLLTTTFVDGTTQAAFLGRPTASILVEVVGLNAAPSDGIVFGPDSDGSLLKSLAVYGFAGSQVRIEGDFDQVFSCYVGISADASARIGLANFLVTAASNPGSDGILVHGSHAMIGSASPGFGNVVSGNRGQGIEFAGAGAFFGQVYGNYVGTDPTGLAAIPNLLDGIVIGPGATAINIQSNLISGNVGVGLEFLATSGNVALANMIGTDATGAAPLGNGGAGVCLDASSTGNQIGRFDSTVGNALVNVISGNKQQGVLIQGGSTGNFVFGNLIGTSKDGLREVHNGVGGVMLVGVSGNMVGPNNVISGNVGNGVEFLGASGNMLAGNLVGTDATGMAALGNSGSGVCLDQGSTGNTIGGVGLTAGNVISGNKLNGLAIQSFSNNNIVLGNKFGTDMLGTGRVGNLQSGVFLTRANGNLIGPGNVSSGNGAFGIELLGASGNIIAGNFIGTDASGQAGLGNAVTGICVDLGSNANLIGGMTADSRNVISSNAVVGVAIQGGSIANMVLGNRIGTNVDGTKALGNGIAGVLISESSDNLVGFGNVISGNGSAATPGAGIWVDGLGSTGNQLVANFVGTNFDGSSKLPNNAVGILLNDAPRNIVGGTSPLASNVISGNSLVGLMISGDGATGNLVLGNKIGTDVTGSRKVGNGGATQGVGLYLLGAGGNTIGGTTLDLANVISGNSFDGVELFGPGSTGNVIQGNLIGLDASGTRPLGNGDDGIVFDEAPRNLVLSNYIGSNARNGIFVSGSAGNVLRLNAIGVGVGGQALGNGTFGILIGNNSVGTVEVANLNFNNGIGPERNTDTGVTATSSAPATTAAQKSGGKSATKAKSNAKAVKVQATAKAFASRPLKSLQARGHWKS